MKEKPIIILKKEAIVEYSLTLYNEYELPTHFIIDLTKENLENINPKVLLTKIHKLSLSLAPAEDAVLVSLSDSENNKLSQFVLKTDTEVWCTIKNVIKAHKLANFDFAVEIIKTNEVDKKFFETLVKLLFKDFNKNDVFTRKALNVFHNN